jgi:hypothetical protein
MKMVYSWSPISGRQDKAIMGPLTSHLWLCLVACFLLLVPALSEPVQYCRFGRDPHRESSEVDFCMAVTTQHNHSSYAHDMYLSMVVTRDSAKGWTAIGTGPVMAGSLMFIVYGNPFSNFPPTLSIRTIDGHHQPKVVTAEDLNGASIEVLHSEWAPYTENITPGFPAYVASISLVCHSCTLFPGTPISTDDNSQPWIWAWNDKMEDMEPYAEDLQLTMHEHHAEDGGWGRFYLDMPRSAIDHSEHGFSAPAIQAGVERLGTSDTPMGGSSLLLWLQTNPLVHVHGFLMGLAFLFLAPVGIMGIRSGAGKSFKYHWIIQIIASASILTAAIIGLAFSNWKLHTVHQWVGVGVAITIGVQGILGWRHHMDYLRIRRRTWKSYAHIWLGRIFMLTGWFNFVSGMLLAGYSLVPVLSMSGLIGLEMVGLILFVWLAARRSRREQGVVKQDLGEEFQLVGGGDDEYFALGDDDEDEFSDHDENDPEAEDGEEGEVKNNSTQARRNSKDGDGAEMPMLKK